MPEDFDLEPPFDDEVDGDDRLDFDDSDDSGIGEYNSWGSSAYCRHLNDAGQCDDKCSGCGHQCYQHGRGECEVDDCTCEEFMELNHHGE